MRSAGGALLKRTLHTFAVGPLDYTWAPLAGLWRTFSYEAATEEQLFEGGSTSSSVKHLYTYDLTQNTNLNGVIYGNLSKDETYLNGVRYRIAMFFYTGVDTGVDYLVDRVRTSVQWDGAWNTLAFTAHFYDGSNSDGGIGSCSGASSCGLLTRESALFDVPLQNNLAGLSLHSRDTSYGYDAYGNQTSTTTYTGPGSAVLSGSTWGYSAPGSGSSARTSITAYDPTYHALPISQTNPLGQSQTATYDWRMGTLTKVTDANAIDTTATYDALGRMITLVKPGDSAAFPTLTASYDDGAFPFRYRYLQREVAGAGGMRWTQVFYDGMGRQIETKVESRDIAPYQNTDTFTAYDGLGRVTQQSQPLFVDEADVNVFLEYTNPSGVSGVRWTSLTYDGLGRVRTQTDPGGKVTTHTYSIASGNLSDHTLVDAQQHRVHQQSDGLGRLVKVIEDAGTGAWSTYATTSYAYTPLDLLDTATDAQGNVTDLDYDSLGRKTRSVDPDMGTWYYAYDMDGNLVTQTDASQRTQVFNYDALGRLTSRMAEDSGPTSTFADGFDAQSSLNWTWSSYQSVASSMVSSTGSGSGWNAEFSRSSYDLSDGDGLALSLKLSGTNPNAIFAVETGSGAAYRRLQLLVLNGQFGTQTTLDGSNYTTFTPLMSVQANVWYRLTMTLDDRAGFRVQVAQDGAPQTRATQLISMPPGQSWRFHHWIYAANTATIDSYSEYQGPRYGYDQGTNGKGRRTSMALGTGAGALASTSWSYDSRGRVTNTREDVSGLPSSGRSFSRSYDSADRVVSQSFPAANSAAAETLSYAYDAGWRQTSVCSSLGGCYAQSASYLASGQPNAWTLGNGLVQNWMYDVLNRPVRLQLGTSASVSTADNLSAAAADRFDRQYSFDDVGNVLSLTDKRGAQPLQSYVYDARDRLTSWTLGGTTQSYTYDLIGNLTSKAGISQTYGSTGLGSGTGPHQARSVGGATYSYDATGNLISGGGRNIAWNTDNLPYTVTSGGVPEGYLYNADSARVKKVRGSVSTYYLDGMWEEDSTGMVRKYYTLGDQTVASRTVTSTTNAVSYLQGDNLGSVSLTTDASGVAGTPQEFDPWGKVRSGVISATRRNYTGQYLDDTGLLFYNAALRHFLWS